MATFYRVEVVVGSMPDGRGLYITEPDTWPATADGLRRAEAHAEKERLRGYPARVALYATGRGHGPVRCNPEQKG
jgi:hypothetical protein